MSERNLTDADVTAIVDELKKQLVSDFYGEVGRGVWYWCKKACIFVVLILALYGMAHETGVTLPTQPQVRP